MGEPFLVGVDEHPHFLGAVGGVAVDDQNDFPLGLAEEAREKADEQVGAAAAEEDLEVEPALV